MSLVVRPSTDTVIHVGKYCTLRLPEGEMKCLKYVEQSVSGESVTAINTDRSVNGAVITTNKTP